MSRILIVSLLLLTTACSTSVPIQTDSSGTGQQTVAEDAVQLPPTWTPTASPTPPSPSSTPDIPAENPADLPSDEVLVLADATPLTPGSSTSGWQLVEGATATFMLPASFEVLDMGSEFGMLMAALMSGMMEGMFEVASEIGEELGADPITPAPLDTAEVEAAFSIDFVLAMGSDQKTSAFLFSEPLEDETTLEEQVQAALDEQENPVTILSADRVVGAPQDTARIHLEVLDPDTAEVGQILLYIFLFPEKVYQLGYAADVDQFELLLLDFETSASTFQLISP